MNIYSYFMHNYLKLETTQMGKWINKLWYIYITEYHSATKRNKLLISQQHGLMSNALYAK